MVRSWVFENNQDTADAFNRFAKILKLLLRFIEEGKATVEAERSKRQSPRRKRLIDEYSIILELANDSYLHHKDNLPDEFDEIMLPVAPIEKLLSRLDSNILKPRMEIFNRGEAFWLKESNYLNEQIMLLLAHPYGKWGKKHETAEETGRIGGQASKKSDEITEFVEHLKQSHGHLKPSALWKFAKQYNSNRQFDCSSGGEVYFDGDWLVAKHEDATGSKINFTTFRKNYC